MSEHEIDKRPGLETEVLGEYVAVVFAETDNEAKRCVALLESHGIPATIEESTLSRRRSQGISVLVPDARLDEASDVLATHEAAPGLNLDSELKNGPADDDEDAEDLDEDDDFDDEEEEELDEEDDEVSSVPSPVIFNILLGSLLEKLAGAQL